MCFETPVRHRRLSVSYSWKVFKDVDDRGPAVSEGKGGKIRGWITC